MENRRQLCAQPGATCPPLTWTISNRLADFAPFLLQWYFRYLLPHAVTGARVSCAVQDHKVRVESDVKERSMTGWYRAAGQVGS